MFKQQPDYSEEEGYAFWNAEMRRQEKIDKECSPTDDELFSRRYNEYVERLIP